MWIDDNQHKEFVENCRYLNKVAEEFCTKHSGASGGDLIEVEYFKVTELTKYIYEVLETDRKQMIKIYKEMDKLIAL